MRGSGTENARTEEFEHRGSRAETRRGDTKLFTGLALSDDAQTDVAPWSEIIIPAMRRDFESRDYGGEIRHIVVAWSIFEKKPAKSTIRKGVLVIPAAPVRKRVLKTVPAAERLKYLIDLSLARVAKDSAYLDRRGFDSARYLADLTTFFRVELPKRMDEAGIRLTSQQDKS